VKVAPVIGAGAAFAGSVLAGLAVGVWIGHTTGNQLWALGGFAAGIAVGGYSAFRLLMQSL